MADAQRQGRGLVPGLVTVAIPAYNRPQGLERLLQQVRRQSYRQLDILVSDNCSPNPEVAAVARRHGAEDPRLRLVRQRRNLGYSGNHAYLLRHGRGEFFAWLHDDDEFPEDYIERCVVYLRQQPEVVLASGSCDRFLDDVFQYRYEDCCQLGQDTYARLRGLLPDGFSCHWRHEHYQYGVFRRAAARHRFSAEFKAEFHHFFALAAQGALANVPELSFRKHTSAAHLANHASGDFYRHHWWLRPFAGVSPSSVQQCTPLLAQMTVIILNAPGLTLRQRARLLWTALHCYRTVTWREQLLIWTRRR
ncbi:MAG: glycosyltransferase family A protein [Synechococcaceae cyanobacterium]|nr:glycosyltransferase family A protein [Synechococcaceae cyanobacterium]